jgi:hypothetical protein
MTPKRARTPTVDYDRLCQAVVSARKVLEPFRKNRRELVREFAGANWGADAARKKVPVNLLALYTEVVSRSLVSKNPRVMLSTFDRAAKPVVRNIEQWANKQLVAMDLAGTLQEAVDDAMIHVGIVKVALATPGDAAVSGWNMPAGTPFAEAVSLDDFVFDVHAKKFSECSFVGHRIRVPLDTVKNSGLYKGVKDLQGTVDHRYNETGDEKARTMQRNHLAGDADEFEEHADVWEFWLPRQRLVCTFASDDGGSPTGDPIRVVEWVGPDRGPYHFLCYARVHDNAMPKGPLLDLWDLHDAFNKILRKLIRQAERQKEVIPVRGTAANDAERLVETNDGEAFKAENAETLKPISFGGPNAATFQFGMSLKELFSWRAGNLDIMGGLSPQAKTAAQDKMLNENSSRQVTDMQDTTVSFVAEVVDSLCWFWHHHPRLVMDSEYAPKGMPELSAPQPVGPDKRRRVKWADMGVKVDPYSLTHATPQARAAALSQMLTQVIIPMTPLLQQQGISVDMNAFLTKQAAYLDMPDLPEILTISEPVQPGGGGGQDGPATPAQTSREYVRRSVPGKTQGGDNLELAQKMMGAGGQGTSQFAAPTAG